MQPTSSTFYCHQPRVKQLCTVSRHAYSGIRTALSCRIAESRETLHHRMLKLPTSRWPTIDKNCESCSRLLDDHLYSDFPLYTPNYLLKRSSRHINFIKQGSIFRQDVHTHALPTRPISSVNATISSIFSAWTIWSESVSCKIHGAVR